MDALNFSPVLVAALLRWIIGATFWLAAITKWLDIASFRHSLEELNIIPRPIVPSAAVGIASLESVFGLAFLLNWQHQITAISSFFMVLGFTSVLAIKLRRGATTGCGCFGPRLDNRLGAWTFFRNALLLLLSLLVFFSPYHQWNPLPVLVLTVSGAFAAAWWLTHPKQQASAIQEAGRSLPSQIIPQASVTTVLSRRDFLRQSGVAGIAIVGASLLHGLGITSVLSATLNPNTPNSWCQQTYYHYQRCGVGCPSNQMLYHRMVRNCSYNPCDGNYTYWVTVESYCITCDCYCDIKTCNCPCTCQCCDPCSVCTDECY